MAIQSVPGCPHGQAGLGELSNQRRADFQAAKETSGNLIELVIPLIEESLQSPAKEHFEDDGIEL